jgi:hypothetical protein
MKEEAAMARYDDYDDDSVFDENGLLKDGRRMRVSVMMRDSASDVQRAVAEDAVARRFGLRHALDLHQPGPRFCTDAAANAECARAYAEMCDEMQNAWRTPAADAGGPRCQKPGDQCTINGAPGHLNERLECVPDRQDARPVYDAAESCRIKAAAYQQMVDEMTSAWKGPAR